MIVALSISDRLAVSYNLDFNGAGSWGKLKIDNSSNDNNGNRTGELMMKTITKRFAVFTGLTMLAGSAMAAATVPVPEPSTLSLLGMAGVVGLVIAIRKRRK